MVKPTAQKAGGGPRLPLRMSLGHA
jgi:hypothetical protein